VGGVVAESLTELKDYLASPADKNIFVTQPLTLVAGESLVVPGTHKVTFIEVPAQARTLNIGDKGSLTVQAGSSIKIDAYGLLEFRKGSFLDIQTLDKAPITASDGIPSFALEDETCVLGNNTIGALGQAGVVITVNGIVHKPNPSEGAADILRVKTLSYVKAAFEPVKDDGTPNKDDDVIWFTPITGISAWGAKDVRYGKIIYTENGGTVKLPPKAGNGYTIEYTPTDLPSGVTYNSGTNALEFEEKTRGSLTLDIVITYTQTTHRIEGVIIVDMLARTKDITLSLHTSPDKVPHTVTSTGVINKDPSSEYYGYKTIKVTVTPESSSKKYGLFNFDDTKARLGGTVPYAAASGADWVGGAKNGRNPYPATVKSTVIPLKIKKDNKGQSVEVNILNGTDTGHFKSFVVTDTDSHYYHTAFSTGECGRT
jgi:hypothetical protein